MAGAILLDRGSLASGGLIHVGGNVTGSITMSTDCTNFPAGLVGDITVSGNMDGSIQMCNDSSGDITVAGSMGGSISIGKKLKSDGRILITGVCNGAITIGEETESLSLIRAVGGLGSSGAIRINDSRGDFDARGNIHFGTTASIVPTPPPSVTFDGSIKILRNSGNTDGGDLIGGITVIGCHATNAALDICIGGTNSGRVSITQTSCTNQVSWSCVSGCS